MEEKKNKKSIPLNVIGWSEEDLTEFETKEGTAHLLDVSKLKTAKGGESCFINDMKEGLSIEMQSFKHSAEKLGGLCLNVFQKVKSQRNFNNSRSYFG